MGGKTFRSRWVVRWGVLFGGLCTAFAVVLFLAALHKTQNQDSHNDAISQRNAKTCEDQIATGGVGDDSPCAQRLSNTADESAKGYLSAGVLFIVGLTQLIGAGRVGVTLTGTGLIVRNPLRTYRLRWSEIKGFRTEVGTRGPMSYAFGRIDLLNGDTHRIEAICAMPWEHKDTFLDNRVIEALNAELAAHHEANPDKIEIQLGSDSPRTADTETDDLAPIATTEPDSPAAAQEPPSNIFAPNTVRSKDGSIAESKIDFFDADLKSRST